MSASSGSDKELRQHRLVNGSANDTNNKLPVMKDTIDLLQIVKSQVLEKRKQQPRVSFTLPIDLLQLGSGHKEPVVPFFCLTCVLPTTHKCFDPQFYNRFQMVLEGCRWL